MNRKECKSRSVTKELSEFGGFKTCNRCREATRKGREEYNLVRRQERENWSRSCEECGRRVKHENWDVHFYFGTHPNSELYNLPEELDTKLRELREQGNVQMRYEKKYTLNTENHNTNSTKTTQDVPRQNHLKRPRNSTNTNS